ncbi:MAG: PIN domain-containing protein [Betaproteobacteria bacterium]|nr:MAG: PIN domain-containing protein [Betaproteobacteria bacterium]
MAARKSTVLTAREAAPPPYGPPGASVLVDSGPLLALFNRSDRWHTKVSQWLLTNPSVQLVTTWSVLTEACAMLARRVHNEAALDVLRWALRGGITVDGAPQDALVTVLAVSERFADLPFDLADASVAEAAARLRIRRILSIDSDFDVYRDQAGRALKNVLLA